MTDVWEIVIRTDPKYIYSFQGKIFLEGPNRRECHTSAIVFLSKNVNCFPWEILISIGRYGLNRMKKDVL